MDNKKKTIIIVVIVAVLAIGCFALKGIMTKPKNKLNSKDTISQATETKKKDPTTINLGEKISNEDIEMTFVSVDFKDEIKWKMSEYSTMSESIGEGKVGVSISGTFKNLRGEAINKSNIIGKAVVDGKYTYDLTFAPHTSGTYKVEPLESLEYDFYAEVPNEIKDSYNKIEFTFGYNNDFDTISTQYVNGKKVDPLQSLDNLYSLTVTK